MCDEDIHDKASRTEQESVAVRKLRYVLHFIEILEVVKINQVDQVSIGVGLYLNKLVKVL